jgi:protein arginine kinase activator
MLCQRCHKNLATVRYAEVVDGKVTDRHLCEACMAQYQEGRATGFELTGPQSTARHAAAPPPARESAREQRACPTCGAQLAAAGGTWRLGCPRCYEMFEDQLDTALRDVQHALVHRGKNPHITDARVRLRADLQTKRTLLRTLLRREKYEEAAVLRDEIQEMESGQSTAGAGNA